MSKLTNNQCEEFFYNSLCNTWSMGVLDGYGIELTWDDTSFDEARAMLTNPCIEDTLMQILRNGGKLTMVDEEGGEDSVSITMQDVHDRVPLTPKRHLDNAIEENDDSETGDVILQTVFYQDIVFG